MFIDRKERRDTDYILGYLRIGSLQEDINTLYNLAKECKKHGATSLEIDFHRSNGVSL